MTEPGKALGTVYSEDQLRVCVCVHARFIYSECQLERY